MSSSFDEFWNSIDLQQKNNTIDEPFEIGKVTSIDPLVVELEGLPLYKKNLYINPHLLAWDEEVNITTSMNDKHSHTITTIHHRSKLKLGLNVACYGINYDEQVKTYQKYCVLEVLE
ncbi:DUF2577 domain-containing protein [Clostridium botulinum]|nr:DUF2577 domain-containing protein [Clostridium botulinum]NFJ41043.1 DUF2577 domain-containing protein [Clostridium botulinum B str. Eklund 17B (NRP)]MBY6999299.1 DUF2577 domain-containing protein [Clostridium botulinum]MCR1272618.1 DUF2577 domain-containing protein [Clostridium botulinum]NFD70006.1 DUF2577 domain-containing protein [Clostridium botulinum]